MSTILTPTSVRSTSVDPSEPRPIPWIDLQAQYRAIRGEIQDAVMGVLDTGQYVLGPEVAAFEQEFAAFTQAEHGIAVNSGTSALHLALLAAGVGPGDEVITVAFTFIATLSAIEYCGATPVLVDIDPVSFTMDTAAVERAITPRTKAILPVHLFGQAADLAPLLQIARAHGLRVIEDAAQAHGAEYQGRRVGAQGDLGCFSFYPTKNLGAYGEGGLVTTNDPALAAQVRLLRDWGQARKYQHVVKAFNFRMEGLQGAILRVKLRYLEQWTTMRRQVAHWYGQSLGASVVTPVELAGRRHVYHTYTVRVPGTGRRDALQQYLAGQGIGTAIHYPVPAHLQEAFGNLGYGAGSLPESERAAGEVLSLPMWPELAESNARRVASAVGSFDAG